MKNADQRKALPIVLPMGPPSGIRPSGAHKSAKKDVTRSAAKLALRRWLNEALD